MNRKKSLLLVVCLACLLSLPWLNRAFYSRGEPREALVAQSMLVNSNWISPPAYDGAVPSKPPFSHWLIALSSLPIGHVSEATARFPSAVAFILFSIAFYLFVARRTSEAVAFGVSVLLLSFPEWFRAASTCRVDTILATSFTGALLALFAWYERGQRGIPWLGIGLLSIATLTKGPIGLVLPLGTFGLFLWSESGFAMRSAWRIACRSLVIALPVIACASLWYLAGYMQRGDEFIDKVKYENFDRLTSSMQDEPHKHSVFYLFGVLALGLFPWSLIVLILGIQRLSMLSSLVRGGGPRLLEQYRALPLFHRFSLLAACSVVLFFCIPSSKRGVYLLPAYPFIAVMAVGSMERLTGRLRGVCGVLASLLRWSAAAIVIAVGIVISGAINILDPRISEFSRAFAEGLSIGKVALVFLLGGGCWVALRNKAGQKRQLPAYVNLSVALVIAVSIVSFCIVDPIMLSLSPKRWISSASEVLRERGSSREFFSFGSEAYASSFYLERPFMRAQGLLPGGSIVLVQERDRGRFHREISPEAKEVARYESPFESSKRALIFFRIP